MEANTLLPFFCFVALTGDMLNLFEEDLERLLNIPHLFNSSTF